MIVFLFIYYQYKSQNTQLLNLTNLIYVMYNLIKINFINYCDQNIFRNNCKHNLYGRFTCIT
jgi:hypothetical protein